MTPTTLVLDALKRIPGEAKLSEVCNFSELHHADALAALIDLELRGQVLGLWCETDLRWRLVEER